MKELILFGSPSIQSHGLRNIYFASAVPPLEKHLFLFSSLNGKPKGPPKFKTDYAFWH